MVKSFVNLLKLSILSVILFGITPYTGFSQSVLNTASGQKLLIAQDGSWSIMKQDETLDPEGNVIVDSSTSLDAFSAPSQGKYPLTVDEMETVKHLLKSLQSDEAQLLVNTEFFKRNLSVLDQDVKQAKVDKDKDQIKTFQNRIKETRKALKNSETAYKASTKAIQNANDLLAGKVKKKSKLIAALTSTNANEAIENSGMGGSIEEDSSPLQEEGIEPEKSVETNKVNEKFSTSFVVNNQKYPRDEYDCEIVFDGYDESLGSDKKEVKAGPFFGYSQEKMKAYFKNDDFIKCDASVSKVDKKYYLTLNMRIQSKDAKKTYGMLRANETIRIELIDGSKLYCENMIQDNGTIEAYTGHTLYTGIYRLKKDDVKSLKKKYLDNIGIMWSSGFEQYNIFNVDFLRNQISCLEK